MNIVDLLAPRRVVCIGSAASKEHLLELLGELLAIGQSTVTVQAITESLRQRERVFSTGIGEGIALPHVRLGQGSRIIGAFIQLKQGVEFEALDNQPVDLVFGLLEQEQVSDERHLKILSCTAAMFSDHAFCQQLRSADTAQALFERLIQWQPVLAQAR